MDGACPDWNPSRCDELYQGIVEGVLCRTTNCQMQIVGENQWKIDKKRRSPVLILLALECLPKTFVCNNNKQKVWTITQVRDYYSAPSTSFLFNSLLNNWISWDNGDVIVLIIILKLQRFHGIIIRWGRRVLIFSFLSSRFAFFSSLISDISFCINMIIHSTRETPLLHRQTIRLLWGYQWVRGERVNGWILSAPTLPTFKRSSRLHITK